MARLADEAWDKVDPVQVRAAGIAGLIGYISEDNTGKNLTSQNVHDAHSAGLSVTLVYEYAPSAPLQGGPRGQRDAAVAVSHADALMAPHGITLYVALDENFSEAQMPTVAEYLSWYGRDATDAGFRYGPYGGYHQLAWLYAHGYRGQSWQGAGWSDGLWLPQATIRQTTYGVHIAGGIVDLDDSTVPDWGQWDPPLPVPPHVTEDVFVNHWHTVQMGSKGQAVMVAQGLLLAHGLDVGSGTKFPDGDFGPHTLASTRALQSRYGIAVDGIFGPHTASVALYGVDVV